MTTNQFMFQDDKISFENVHWNVDIVEFHQTHVKITLGAAFL